MFLRELTLTNIRGFRSAKHVFAEPGEAPPRITLFLGENGLGKSSLLPAIALITAGSDALGELMVDLDDWIHNDAQFGMIEALIDEGEAAPRYHQLKFERGDSLAKMHARNHEMLLAMDEALARSAKHYLTIGYGVSRRASDAALQSRRRLGRFTDPRSAALATLFSPTEELIPIESWAMDLEYRRGMKAGRTVIAQAIDALIPGVKMVGVDRESRRLMLETTEGKVSFGQLSDGFQSTLSWIGDLLYRVTELHERYEDPLSAKGLLLLDEIELHLHPRWQRALIGFLRQGLPNLQIVATTHSPVTAQQVGPRELHVLARGPGGPEVRPIGGDPRKLFVHQLLGGPAFGSLDMTSAWLDDKRAEYSRLAARKTKLSTEERAKLRTLREELADMPDWTRMRPGEQQRLDVLEKLERKLEQLDGTPRATKKKKAATKKKAKRGAR